jgi:hypothetical protein
MNWTPVVRAKRAVLQVGKLVRGVGMPRGFLAVVAVAVIVGLILLLWKVPQWQLASWQSQLRPADSTLTSKDFAQVENEFRATWAQIVGGMVLLLFSDEGRMDFRALLASHGWLHYAAFDLLWLNGKDLRALPLIKRKRKLEQLIPANNSTLSPMQPLVPRPPTSDT